MLLKEKALLEAGQEIRIEKRVCTRSVCATDSTSLEGAVCNIRTCDASMRGAFAFGEELLFRAVVPRRLGIAAVVLRIAPDGGDGRDLAFSFSSRQKDSDIYTLTLSTEELCPHGDDGLFFYEYLFLRGFDTLFSDSVNNYDFTLTDHSANRFRLLVYSADFETPAWFHGGTMYHVFPDRFCRGKGAATLHGGRIDPDWENGIPQYALHAGDELSNDVFFGGNLWGVVEKLDYLASLGVTVLYLSPVFEAASNHRYDTSDYEKIDSLLGGKEAFDKLIAEAHARGMKVILDGVFNHTGDDSRYFNRRGNYPDVGAYQSPQSPYAKWYSFSSFPQKYEAWWGIEIMPRLNHKNDDCRRYFTGMNGIAAKWLRAGADGWRLDVADELPDVFLDELHDTVKELTDGKGLIIGEVWENAVDKIAYGSRRRYFRGGQLDSVMNYPFRNAVLAFLLDRDAETFYNILTELWATYPTTVSHSLMNLLGTHDTERILTVLGDRGEGEGLENPALAVMRLSNEAKREAKKLLKIASTLQFTVYGVPSVYYGDEAGLDGYHDPFCRMPFPWGREDKEILEHYQALGRLRREHPCLSEGDFKFLCRTKHAFAFERFDVKSGDRLTVAANMEKKPWQLHIPGTHKTVTVDPMSAVVIG